MPQTQEEFYFALPYDLMDLCLYAVNHGISAADDVASVVGLTAAQVERVFRDIDAKRRAARYLHARPLPVAQACRGLTGMCGIAGIVVVERRRGAALARSADAHGRRAGPSRSRRVRPVPRRARGPGTCPPVDHRSCRAASSRSPTRRHDVDRVQRRDLQLRRAADELVALGHRFRTRATPRSSSTPTRRGAKPPSSASTASGRSRSGTRRHVAWSWRAIGLGVRPLYVCEHAGRLYFASEVKAIFAGGCGDPARLRSRRPRSDLHVLDGRAAAGRVRGHQRTPARDSPHL